MANNRSTVGGIAAVWSLAIGASALVALAQAPPAPTPAPTPAAAPKAAAAVDEAPLCASCHEDEPKSFAHNPHNHPIAAPKGQKWDATARCQSCHGEATKHMESSGEDKSDLRVFKTSNAYDFCTTCHRESQAHASFRTGIHANSETVSCATCHSIHHADAKTAHLNTKPTHDLCQSCHPSVAAMLREKPFTHRPVNNVMECTSCHDPHGRQGRESLKLTRAGELPCLSCHSEKRGPFVFEHPPALASDGATACLKCHEPHGSSNPKMLVRSQVQQVCLECHSQIPIGSTTMGSQPPSFHNIALPRYRNCTTCHVAVHGSNLSPQLLK